MSIKKALFIAVVAVMAGAGSWFLFFADKNGVKQTLTVQRGDFEQQVSVSGKVIPVEDLDLSFEESGRVTAVFVNVGDRVRSGELLASQDTTQLRAQLAETRADIQVEKAKLQQLLAGASEEDIAVAEVDVQNAKIDVENAKQFREDARQKMVDTLQDTYTKADDAVRGKVDQLFMNPRGKDPQLSVGFFGGAQLETDVEWQRSLLESILTTWASQVSVISIASDLPGEVSYAKKNLSEVSLFLDDISLVVNGLTANSNVTQATIDKWRPDVAAARTNVNTAVSNLTSAETNIKTKEADLKALEGTLSAEEHELLAKKAPARSTDIALYEAQIQKAEANAVYIEVQLGKREIRSPLAGVVTEVPAKIGSILAANETAISLMSADVLQIESFVPELTISYIEKGDEALVALDTYGEDMPFRAQVISIDPAETIRDGVSTYRIKLQFTEEDQRIKSGMTANITITTEKKTGVISIPQGIITVRDGKKYVRVREGQAVVEREVSTGSISSFGNIEILLGLEEGDVVLLGAIEK